MGTILPKKIIDLTFELANITFIKEYPDSLLSIAFQLCINLKATEILLFGLDGYDMKTNEQMIEVSEENQLLIDNIRTTSARVFAITPTNYQNLQIRSIYSLF